MIVKRSPAKQAKSKGQHIYDLYHYIHASFDRKSDQKVIQSGTLNMTRTDDSAAVITEMESLASKSVRTRMPIEHWILSLPEDEHFDPRTTKDIVGMFIDGLGYEGCQTIYAIHGNTDHEHLHLIVNHVDPKTLQCRKSDWQVLRAHKALARICDTFGFSTTDHQTYVKNDNGEYVRAVHTASDQDQVRLPNNAAEAEVRSGEKSMIRIAVTEALPIIRSAKSWAELHSGLAKIGFTYVKKGGGAVLVGHLGGENYPMKASSVYRSCSLKNLQKRLGQYTPSTATVAPRKPEPVDGISQDELEKYKQYRRHIYNNNAALTPKHNAELDKLINELDRLKIEYNRLRSENPTNITDRALIKAHSEYIKEQQISSISNKINVLKSANAPVATQPLPFNEWSSHYKHQDHFVNVKSEITSETQSQIQVFNQIHQAINSQYYQIHAEKDGKTTQIYYNSSGSRNYTANDIITQVLPRAHMTVYCAPIDIDTRCIYIPQITQEEWNYIMWLRDRREIQPALVLRNNDRYNVYFKVCAPTYQNEQIIYRKINATLKVNIKVKSRIPLPTKKNNIEVIGNTGKECYILSDWVRKLDGLIINKRKNINKDDEELYKVHYNDIIKRIKRKYAENEIYEMIGVRLRSTGHTRMDIVRILGQHTDTAQVIVDKVYGDAGDRQLIRFRRFLKAWKLLEERLDHKWYERLDTIPTITPEQQDVYQAHYNDIMMHVKKQIEDKEKIDRMIAVRLRSTGHTQDEIAKIISVCSEKDKRYGQRIAKEMFGEYGDKQLNQYWKYLSDWRMLEQPKLNNYNNDNIKLYNTHYNDIIRLTRKPNTEPEKIDGMIAIRLRATGHDRREIAAIIEAGRQQGKDYATKIIDNAFTEEGDKQIKKYSKFAKEWKLIEEGLDLKWYLDKERMLEEAKEKERRREVERIEEAEEEDTDQQLRM